MRILYLHGFASGPASKKAAFFKQRIPSLEIPDLADGDFEHLTVTAQLEKINKTVGDETVSLVGSSMGGYLAALYAAEHANVAKVVLLAPAFGFARRWSEAPEANEWRKTGVLNVYHCGDKRTRQLGYQLLEDGLRYDDFPEFEQPALIFHGIHDAVVPARTSADFAATHPNTKLHLLDSDHELLNVLESIWQQSRRFL